MAQATAAPPATTVAAAPHIRRILIVTCLAPALALMNYTTPLINLPDTTAGLGASTNAQTWIMNGMPLGLAASLMVVGTLADNFGRKRLLIWGASAMALASIIAAAAVSPGMLIAARIMQGLAASALLSASLGKLGYSFSDPAARARATGLWAAAMGAGLALGPLAAGALTSAWNWRVIYAVLAVAAVVLAAGAGTIGESRAAQRRPIDLPGIATLAVAMTALLAAVTFGRDGWTQPLVLSLFAVTVLGLIAFAIVESRRPQPMIDLTLFKHSPFLLSILGSGLNGLLIIGALSILSTVWQQVHGFSPLTVAAIFTVWPTASLLAALVARRLRIAPVRLLALGFVLAATQIGLWGTTSDWSLAQVLITYLIAGVGAGFSNAANARMAIDSVPPDQASMGSGAANTARYVGSSVGVALAVALIGANGPSDGVDLVLEVSAALLLLCAVFALFVRRTKH